MVENLYTKTISSNSIKKNINDKKKNSIKSNDFYAKKDFNKVVYKIYNLVNNYKNTDNKQSVYDVLNNSKMILLKRFDYNNYYTYRGIDQLIGNFSDIKGLDNFIRHKYFNKLNSLEEEKVIISINGEKKVDKVLVNNQGTNYKNNKYYYKSKGLVYLTVAVLKKGCIPGIYKVSYSPTVNLSYKCTKLYKKTKNNIINGELKLNNNISLDIGNKNIDYIEYNILNQQDGENNGMLNLPVISKNGKILSNHFTTYGMPYIKMYKNNKLVNGCILGTEKLTNYSDLKNKVIKSSIKERKWYSTLFINKKIGFGWRNLNEKKGIWEPGEIMFINKNKGIIKFKYCYNFK